MSCDRRIELKILGASAGKADANLYLDGEKIGEAVIRRNPDQSFDLFDLLGEVLRVVPARQKCSSSATHRHSPESSSR